MYVITYCGVHQHEAPVRRKSLTCTNQGKSTHLSTVIKIGSTSNSSDLVINPKTLVSILPDSGDTPVSSNNVQVVQGDNANVPACITQDVVGDAQVVVGNAFGPTYSANTVINPNKSGPILSKNNDTLATTGNTEVAIRDYVTVTGEFDSLDHNMEELSEDDILIPNSEALQESFLLGYDYKIPTRWFD